MFDDSRTRSGKQYGELGSNIAYLWPIEGRSVADKLSDTILRKGLLFKDNPSTRNVFLTLDRSSRPRYTQPTRQ